MSTAPFCAAAARYAARGLAVFPLAPRGKHPLEKRGFHAATTDLARIEAWCRRWPLANLGLAPGRSGLLVVDIDGATAEDAAGRLSLLAEPTLTVSTGRPEFPRARHLYFQHPGFAVGNQPLARHLDVRGDAGYVLVPPSLHPSGRRYRFCTVCVPQPLPLAARAALEVAQRRPATLRRPAAPAEPDAQQDRLAVAIALDALHRLASWRADGYLSWVAVGMACHSVSSSAEMLAQWRNWSQRSASYRCDEDECAWKWRSFRGTGVTIATLIYWAREDSGWSPSGYEQYRLPPQNRAGGVLRPLAVPVSERLLPFATASR